MQVFIWLAIRNRCWTADRLQKRGLPHPGEGGAQLVKHLRQLIDVIFFKEVVVIFKYAALLGGSHEKPKKNGSTILYF